MATLEEKYEATIKKLDMIKKQLLLKKNREKSENKKKLRAVDLRKKILAGAWIIKVWGDDVPPDFLSYLSDNDRKFFLDNKEVKING